MAQSIGHTLYTGYLLAPPPKLAGGFRLVTLSVMDTTTGKVDLKEEVEEKTVKCVV